LGVMYDPRDEERQLGGLSFCALGCRSLQDTPDAAINQCSSWKSLGNIAGPPGFSSHGVYCQVGPKAAEGNEWKECVDGTTKPESPAITVTDLCPGSWSARSLGDSPVDQLDGEPLDAQSLQGEESDSLELRGKRSLFRIPIRGESPPTEKIVCRYRPNVVRPDFKKEGECEDHCLSAAGNFIDLAWCCNGTSSQCYWNDACFCSATTDPVKIEEMMNVASDVHV